MPAALMVSYPPNPGATFDRDYYVVTHLPLAREQLGPLGMTNITGYFPESPGAPLAIAILTFADAAARDAALGSEAAGPVFADIPNFTNVEPTPTPLAVG